MDTSPKIIAEFYNITAAERRAHPGAKGVVQIVGLAQGFREEGYRTYVTGKVEARQIAETMRATPWNF